MEWGLYYTSKHFSQIVLGFKTLGIKYYTSWSLIQVFGDNLHQVFIPISLQVSLPCMTPSGITSETYLWGRLFFPHWAFLSCMQFHLWVGPIRFHPSTLKCVFLFCLFISCLGNICWRIISEASLSFQESIVT